MKLEEYIKTFISLGASKFRIPVSLRNGIAVFDPDSHNTVSFEVKPISEKLRGDEK